MTEDPGRCVGSDTDMPGGQFFQPGRVESLVGEEVVFVARPPKGIGADLAV